MHLKLVSMIVTLCSAMVLAQPATQPSVQSASANDTPEQKEVRDAMKDFATLIDKDDTAGVKAAFAGTDADYQFVVVLQNAMKTMKRAKAVMEKKFPEEMAKRRQSDDLTLQSLLREIDRNPVQINGEEASIGKGSDSMTLKRVDGKWRVTDLIGDQMGKGMMMAMLPAMTSAMNEIADEIEAGKHATFADVEKAMQAKMQASRRATTRPSTQPAK